MFTKLTTSTTVDFPQCTKNHDDSEPNTSQTLTALPSLCGEADQVYFRPDVTFEQLLAQTLSHGRLDTLQDKLRAVLDSGRAMMQTETSQTKIISYEQNLEIISEKLQSGLSKIAEERQLIRQKLTKMFLLQSKRTQIKNIRKANLLKYRDLLLAVKQLHDKNFKSESQVTQLKQRLRTSGLFLVPSLVEHAIVELVKGVLADQAQHVEITDIQHLQVVVSYFMNYADPEQTRGQSSSSEHPLYQKFKMYIRLKKYIIVQRDSKDLDALCQSHIRDYYWRNISSVSATEHIKVRSLVQSCEAAKVFLKKQSAQHIKFALVASVNLLHNIREHTGTLTQRFVDPILKRNKKITSKQRIVSMEVIRFLEETEQISVESICHTLQVVDQRSPLLSLHQKQFGLEFEAVQVKKLIVMEAIKCLLAPLLRVLVGLNYISYETKERNYQNSRLVYRRILTWSSLFGEAQQAENSLVMQKIRESIDLLTFDEQTPLTPKENALKTKKKNRAIEKDSLSSTIAEVFIMYHNSYGETYMYLAGKFDQLNQEQMKLCSENKFEPLSFANLMAVWTELISCEIVNHLICEFQPANILKNIEFRQDDVLSEIDSQHKMENKLSQIYVKLSSSPSKALSKTQISEETKEETYPLVLELNLRTRNYGMLMEICRRIGVYDFMKSQNNTVYEELFKKKFFNFI